MSLPFIPLMPADMQASADEFGMSPGVESGEFLFISGQLGVESDGTIAEDGERQAELAFEGLQRVLAEAGATLDDIVQLQTFHLGDIVASNEWFVSVKARYLKAPYPSWNGVGVSSLGATGAVIEIAAIARIPA